MAICVQINLVIFRMSIIKEVAMKTLFILDDAPYGSERTYNGLRLADSDLTESAHRSTLAELTEWTVWSDKTLVF